MKKIIIFALLWIFCFTNLQMNVAAKATCENNIVTITEIFGTEAAKERFTLSVYKPNADFETFDPLQPDTILPFIQHIAEVEADEEGQVTLIYPQNSESGAYHYAIKSESGNFSADGILYYTNQEAYEQAMEELANILNGADEDKEKQLQILLTDNLETLQLTREFPIYKEIAKASTWNAYKRLVDILSPSVNQETLISEFQRSLLLCPFENKNQALMQTVLQDYSHLLNLDSTIISYYNRLSSKPALLNKLGKEYYQGMTIFQDIFYKAVVIEALNDSAVTPSWINFSDTLKEVKDITRLDTGKLFSLNNSLYNKVVQSLVNKRPFLSESDFTEIIENTIQEVNTANEGKGNTSGARGGIGSGSASNNASMSMKGLQADLLELMETEAEPMQFVDLESVEWAKEAIIALAQMNIVSGKGAQQFAPEDFVTREEFLKMLLLTLELNPVPGEVKFTDVEENSWYSNYVVSAVHYGITKGKEDNVFGVGENISRQDATVMIVRALEAVQENVERTARVTTFADDEEIADYSKEAVYLLVEKGVISGIGENLFAPKEFLTRAQAAKMIYGLRR